MIYRPIGIIAISFILTACGGSSSSDPVASPSPPKEIPLPPEEVSVPPEETPAPPAPPVVEVFLPESKPLQTVSFVDALNKPLASAEVVFTPVMQAANFSIAMAESESLPVNTCADNAQSNSIVSTTADDGELSLAGLGEGVYQVRVCKSAVNVSINLTILANNASPSTAIAVPVVANEDGVIKALPDANIMVSVSGVVYSDDGVVANAQIALSGGSLTNGAISTSITDEDGFYSIIVNVNKNKLSALQNATLQIVAEGFEGLNIRGQDFTEFGAFSGVNFKLTAAVIESSLLVYEENFEILSSDSACGAWTSEILTTDQLDNGNSEIAPAESLWHSHNSGLGVVNQAYIANLVALAPNDLSEGRVPNPIEGSKACWYGKTASDGSLDEGNFLNEAADSQSFTGDEVNLEALEPSESLIAADEELSGGTSVVGHAGALISPRIDFSAEVAPLALTFKTWWEIEAVNPNEYGFDLMSVDYQIEGDDSWTTFVRLNPLTDPKGYENLASLPYSNAGFNVAPFWIEQAPISLNRLAGKVFKLRFTFSTEDELFNGFRGWLLDDVKISQREGIFPLWDEVDRILSGDNGPANVETSLSDVTNLTEFSVSLTVRSQNAISAQLRLYDQNGEPLSVAFGRTALIKGEAQDINIVGIIAAPEVEYRVVVELVDANGQIWANADLTFPFADDFPEEGLGPI